MRCCVFGVRVHLSQQGWASILPEGPLWVLDFGERAIQVVLETNRANEDRRLTRHPA